MERSIEAWTGLHAPADRAQKVLHDRAKAIFGQRHVTLSVGGHVGPLVHHEVDLDVGEPFVDVDGTVSVAVSWHATGHEPLFPTFAGRLTAERDDDGRGALHLRGGYAVPLGVIGRFGDGVAGHHVVRRSIEDLLEHTARRLDAAAEPLEDGVDERVYEVTVRSGERSEVYIG
jgi:hypothetical protein